jgi:hypothetical protein
LFQSYRFPLLRAHRMTAMNVRRALRDSFSATHLDVTAAALIGPVCVPKTLSELMT